MAPILSLHLQIHSMVQKLAQFTDVRVALIVGGLSLQVQAASLRSRPEVIVATPVSLSQAAQGQQQKSIGRIVLFQRPAGLCIRDIIQGLASSCLS